MSSSPLQSSRHIYQFTKRKLSCNLFAIAIGFILFGSTRSRVVGPQAFDLVPRNGDLGTRTGDCIEMHIYIQDDPLTTDGDCAAFQLWRNGVQVGLASQCQTFTTPESVYHVGFSDGTTASTTGRGAWISVSGVPGNLNLVARKFHHYREGRVGIGEYELAGNTANLDAAGCAGYNNSRLCDFMTYC